VKETKKRENVATPFETKLPRKEALMLKITFISRQVSELHQNAGMTSPTKID
jgi:hypothetical protein